MRDEWRGQSLDDESDLDYVVNILAGQAEAEEEEEEEELDDEDEDEGENVPGQSHPRARQVITID